MKAFGLFAGRRRPRVVDISMRADHLWWLAWDMSGRNVEPAPIKVGRNMKEALRAEGYDVKPIQFARVVEGVSR